MAKPLKFPELQSKFERALRSTLVDRSSLSGSELLEEVARNAEMFGIRPEELADLQSNSANYFGRAKGSGVLVSNGPHRGYALAGGVEAGRDVGERDIDDSRGATDASAVLEPFDRGRVATRADVARSPQQQWESLLHFPASLVLARRFGARVRSLPKATDRGAKWGNPDMLMIRSSPLETLDPFLRSKNIDVRKFGLVDDSPRAILSSIELKFGLATNRSLWFQAVAETAANSLWANEAWLVFSDPNRSNEPLDRELLALARSAEVGILEIVVRDDDGTYFDVVEHRAAMVRSRLRIGDLDREQRVGLLTAAHGLLDEFERDGTFLDADGDADKARVLLAQALANLSEQVGFGDRALVDALAPMRSAQPKVLRSLVSASMDHVGELVALPSTSVWDDVRAAIRRKVVAEDAERLLSSVATLLAEQVLA